MHDPTNPDRTVEHPDTVTERLIAVQVLEIREPRSRSEIEIALGDIEPMAIGDAIDALEAEGVLHVDREQLSASRCVRHLDRLGLIAL